MDLPHSCIGLAELYGGSFDGKQLCAEGCCQVIVFPVHPDRIDGQIPVNPRIKLERYERAAAETRVFTYTGYSILGDPAFNLIDDIRGQAKEPAPTKKKPCGLFGEPVDTRGFPDRQA